MKATKYLSLAALALMGTLTSCQSNDEAANSFARPANAVGINVSVGSLQTTRSNPASTDPDEARYFNLGDQVCVSTDGQDPVIFQCQNADQQTWAEAEAGKFLLWKQNEMTFKAYYPATPGTSMTAFTLPADQSSTEKIEQADYMTRQQTCTNVSGNNINLELERKMARVIVNIYGFTNQYDNDEKTVSNVSIYSEASGIEEGNPTGDITAVNPYVQNGTGGAGTTYTALVVPGWGDDGADFIALTDGENNTLLVKGIPELEAGYSYTFNLTVGKNTIQVQSVTVQDWATGTTLAGGQATETPSAPEGAINGKFSVSDTKQVYFSKGNLRYASGAWSFFDNQYEYYNSYSADAWDHFGWSTSATTYGMNTSTDNIYSGDFVDWGATMGTGWFTLTSDEWTYLFNTRSASTVNGTANGRYAKAKVNNVQGMILFPDTYTHPDGVTAPKGVNATDNTGWNGNNYSSADWTEMESAGCVFLPAAGYREGSTLVNADTNASGNYWSATHHSTADYASYNVSFTTGTLNTAGASRRYYGCSVRLVRQVTE